MLVHDLPGASDLSINVGNPHREIDRLVLRVGATGMKDRVTVTEHLVSDDAQLAELTIHRPFKKGKKTLPILAVSLGTDVLPWWKRIKNEQALVRHICLHDGVKIFGLATRNKPFVNSSYLFFIGGRCLSGCWQQAERHDKHASGYCSGVFFHFSAPSFTSPDWHASIVSH